MLEVQGLLPSFPDSGESGLAAGAPYVRWVKVIDLQFRLECQAFRGVATEVEHDFAVAGPNQLAAFALFVKTYAPVTPERIGACGAVAVLDCPMTLKDTKR